MKMVMMTLITASALTCAAGGKSSMGAAAAKVAPAVSAGTVTPVSSGTTSPEPTATPVVHKYDCTKCDAEPRLRTCYEPCVKLLGDVAKWGTCVKACNDGRSRDRCLTQCFPTCEVMTGAPIGPGTDRGYDKCGQCDGMVILVKDEMAEDGTRVRVCNGKMREP